MYRLFLHITYSIGLTQASEKKPMSMPMFVSIQPAYILHPTWSSTFVRRATKYDSKAPSFFNAHTCIHLHTRSQFLSHGWTAVATHRIAEVKTSPVKSQRHPIGTDAPIENQGTNVEPLHQASRLWSACSKACRGASSPHLAGVAEHGVQAVESFSRGVAGGEVAHGLVQSAPLLQPVLDLLARPDERHPVHRRHHRLLHQLAVHVRQHRPRKRLRLGVAPARAVRIGLHPRPHDLGDPRVHVRRLGLRANNEQRVGG